MSVYSEAPKTAVKVPFFGEAVAICYTGNDVGHSFWKVDIEENASWGTDKLVTIDEVTEVGSPPQEVTIARNYVVSGNRFGFYPNKSPKVILALLPYKGKLLCDTNHHYVVKKTYSIDVNKAKDVINKTVQLSNNPGTYHIENIPFTKNCTGQCVYISNDVAGCNAPDGESVVGWRPNIQIPLSAVIYKSYPNPYHHAFQLSEP
ncbi:MAG: hypothetical protein LBC02_00275 [Planctomycetaceae bacterium]|nr:hypothetical protein [Planctomycetaceae bacterium]